MYPRNAASPPRLAIGPVVQITDGAVQTAGVSVKVIPQGGTESAGAGTVAYSADGAVLYTPTQGETDYVAVVFVASKAGCIPATLTVVMSASNVAGYAGLDWSKITAATTTVALTGTTVGRVTLVDTTTVNTDMRGTNNALLAADYVAPLTTAGTAAAVWNALLATYTTSGSFGARVMRLDSASSGNGAKVTGAGHVAADIHELQPGVITAADFSANWLTADGTAADYIAELQAAIGTAANQAIVLDRTAYALTVLAGACSDAQTAAETYTLTIGGNTFTVDYSGLDASGNRGATTLSKV